MPCAWETIAGPVAAADTALQACITAVPLLILTNAGQN